MSAKNDDERSRARVRRRSRSVRPIEIRQPPAHLPRSSGRPLLVASLSSQTLVLHAGWNRMSTRMSSSRIKLKIPSIFHIRCVPVGCAVLSHPLTRPSLFHCSSPSPGARGDCLSNNTKYSICDAISSSISHTSRASVYVPPMAVFDRGVRTQWFSSRGSSHARGRYMQSDVTPVPIWRTAAPRPRYPYASIPTRRCYVRTEADREPQCYLVKWAEILQVICD